jgi:outer membrane protein TolC
MLCAQAGFGAGVTKPWLRAWAVACCAAIGWMLSSGAMAPAAPPEPVEKNALRLLPPTDSSSQPMPPVDTREADTPPAVRLAVEPKGEVIAAPDSSSPPADADPQAPSSGVLDGETASIDLPSALALAGVQNQQLLLARQRVVEAVALRQLAAAQMLPNLNLGLNYDDHVGAIQHSTGQILRLQRQSLYIGSGANAVGSGTPAIPGIQYNFHLSTAIFGYLSTRQVLRTRQFSSIATRNQILLDVALAYVELLRAEGRRAVAVQIRADVAEVVRLTGNYAATGVGRKADAHRAATELSLRNTEILAFEGEVRIASAQLARLLHLDPSTRLHPIDGWVVPAPMVPSPIPLSELIGTAMMQHPELAAQRSAIRETFFGLQAQRLLPFSPQVMVGFSSAGFGGGGNAQDLGAQSEFGNFAPRVDIEVVTYWTLQNLGLGNAAQIAAARARLNQNSFRQLEVLNRVRYDVAYAYALAHARYAQLATLEQAVRSASDAFREDLTRIRAAAGLPIEVLNSVRLLALAQLEYLDAITEYNRAQFQLYVALGQPPADLLARSAPAEAGLEAAPPADEAPRAEIGSIVPVEGDRQTIDLEAAWRLAGVQNPTINLARQVVNEAAAVQRQARLLWFPNLNAGAMYYSHVGNWQSPTGQVINLTDSSFYVGSGAYTMGAQTNAIPGVQLLTQVSDALYEPLATRQETIARRFDLRAENNQTLLDATRAYLELLTAEAQWEALRLSHADVQKVVEATRAYAQSGIGRRGDAHRMEAEGFLVLADLKEAEGRLAIASAALARLLQLDPAVRLRTPGAAMQTVDLVDMEQPLTNLLQIGLGRRPELAALSASIGGRQIRVRQEQMRPLLPLLSLGYSSGGFGGTGNQIPNPPFTGILPRTDFDAMAVWTLQNAGAGNVARVRGGRAVLNESIYQRRQMENQVRMEVTSAYASALAQRRQVTVSLRRLAEAELAFQEDYRRLLGGGALPIEVLNSVQLLVRARESLIDAFVNDNRAQFDLFVALGQPPFQAAAQAVSLIHPPAE